MSRIVRFSILFKFKKKKKRVFLSKDVAWCIIGAVYTHTQHALLQHTQKDTDTQNNSRGITQHDFGRGYFKEAAARAGNHDFYFIFYFLKSNETLVLFIPLTSLRANLLFLFFFFSLQWLTVYYTRGEGLGRLVWPTAWIQNPNFFFIF